MTDIQKMTERLLEEVQKLHHRQELSKTVTEDYFEPGMMEYLDQSDGTYDPDTGKLVLRFESMGTRYDGRTELIEAVQIGEKVSIVRDRVNTYNSNNFTMVIGKDKNIGNVPAALCNAIAPLYDKGLLVIEDAEVSFVEPISVKRKKAKRAVLFVKMTGRLLP